MKFAALAYGFPLRRMELAVETLTRFPPCSASPHKRGFKNTVMFQKMDGIETDNHGLCHHKNGLDGSWEAKAWTDFPQDSRLPASMLQCSRKAAHAPELGDRMEHLQCFAAAMRSIGTSTGTTRFSAPDAGAPSRRAAMEGPPLLVQWVPPKVVYAPERASMEKSATVLELKARRRVTDGNSSE